MKTVMKILGIIACILLISMSTTASTTIVPKKTAVHHATIVHNETVTLHPGQSKTMLLKETFQYKGDKCIHIIGCFGGEYINKINTNDITIRSFTGFFGKKYIYIKAKKPGEGWITARTYEITRSPHGMLSQLHLLEVFNIKIKVK